MRSETGPKIDVRPLAADDLDLVATWLKRPHVARWWGEPEAELADIASFLAQAGPVAPALALLDGRPIAYVQSYDIHGEVDHPYRDQPEGSIGIDISIGEPELVGRGIGPAIIEVFVAQLFAGGAPRIVIDPHPGNATAIRAYEKAGFRPLREATSQFGPALIMVRDAPAPAAPAAQA